MAVVGDPQIRPFAIPIWIGSTAVFGLLYALVPVNPDQEMFDYIAFAATRGGHYYVAASDHNWPGVMLLHEAALRLLGPNTWTFRAFDFLLMTTGALALCAILRSAGHRLAGWVALPLYQAMYVTSDIWFSGQRDIIAANLLFASAAVLAWSIRRDTPVWLAACGALIAYATLIRPTYLSNLAYSTGLVFLALMVSAKSWRAAAAPIIRSLFWLWAGAAAVLSAALLWGWASGTLAAWYEQAVLFNFFLSFQTRQAGYIDAIIRLAALATSWHWYLAFSALGLFAWIIRDGVRLELMAAAGIAFTGLLSAIVQRSGFGYHLGALLPVMALLTSVWLASAATYFLRQRSIVSAVAAVVFWGIAIGGLAKKSLQLEPQFRALWSGDLTVVRKGPTSQTPTYDDVVHAANFVRARTQPGDYALVWARHSHILYLAQRQSTTHFSNIGMLSLINSSFPLAEKWFAEFDRELQDRPPRMIVVSAAQVADDFGQFHSDRPVNDAVRRLRALVRSDYEKVDAFGGFEFYQRRSSRDS